MNGWNPTFKNGDGWGMVYYCLTHIALISGYTKALFFFFASPIWGCTDVFLLNYYCVLVPYLRGWFSLGLGLRDGLCLPLEVVNRKSGIQLQSSVFIISPDHSWGIVGNCWSISQQWWMNWRTGTSWANGVVFSCQISEIWFHGIGNTFIQIYISYVYFYLFKN